VGLLLQHVVVSCVSAAVDRVKRAARLTAGRDWASCFVVLVHRLVREPADRVGMDAKRDPYLSPEAVTDGT